MKILSKYILLFSTENIHSSDLVGTELVIFRNTGIYACRYMNAITVNGSRGHEFKGKQEGYMG